MTVSLPAVLLVLGCALAFSGADLLRKLLVMRLSPLPMLLLLSAGMAPAFFIWYLLADSAGPKAGYWLPGIGSVLLNTVANLCFLQAVRVSPLSLTVPMLSLTPVFTSLLAIPMLGEIPKALQWLGICAVVAGAFWLNLERARQLVAESFWRSLWHERGTLLMAAVALLWSLAMPLDKIALLRSSAAWHGLVLNLGVAAGVLALLVAHRGLSDLGSVRRHSGLMVAIIVTSVVALALQLLAMSRVWVGLVETMKRGIGSFMALVLGRVVFGEHIDAHQIVAVLLMGAGVALILV
jgi:drug/metabolite transporter (DMT)-like permease